MEVKFHHVAESGKCAGSCPVSLFVPFFDDRIYQVYVGVLTASGVEYSFVEFVVMRAIQRRVNQAHKIKIKAVLTKSFGDLFNLKSIEQIWFDFDIAFDLLTNAGVENIFDSVLELSRLLVYCASPDHKNLVDKFISLTIFDRVLEGAQKHSVLFLVDCEFFILLVAGIAAKDDVDSPRQRLFVQTLPGLSSHNHGVLLLSLFVIEGLGDATKEF